jgi:hypothetical protein
MPERDGRRFVRRAVVAACIAAVMAPVALDAAGCGGNVVVEHGSGGSTSAATTTSSGTTTSGVCLDPTVPGSPCPTFGPSPGTPCSSPGLCCDYGTCTFTPPMTCHGTQPSGKHTCNGGTWN